MRMTGPSPQTPVTGQTTNQQQQEEHDAALHNVDDSLIPVPRYRPSEDRDSDELIENGALYLELVCRSNLEAEAKFRTDYPNTQPNEQQFKPYFKKSFTHWESRVRLFQKYRSEGNQQAITRLRAEDKARMASTEAFFKDHNSLFDENGPGFFADSGNESENAGVNHATNNLEVQSDLENSATTSPSARACVLF